MAYDTLLLESSFLPFIIVIGIWSAVLKGIALWKAARNSQLAWFVALLVFNTAGILEILYIFLFQKKGQIIVRKKKK